MSVRQTEHLNYTSQEQLLFLAYLIDFSAFTSTSLAKVCPAPKPPVLLAALIHGLSACDSKIMSQALPLVSVMITLALVLSFPSLLLTLHMYSPASANVAL